MPEKERKFETWRLRAAIVATAAALAVLIASEISEEEEPIRAPSTAYEYGWIPATGNFMFKVNDAGQVDCGGTSRILLPDDENPRLVAEDIDPLKPEMVIVSCEAPEDFPVEIIPAQ